MAKWHIQNELTEYVKSCDRFKECLDQERLYSEIKNATLHELCNKLVEESKSGNKRSNDVNSILLWVLEITDEFPSGSQKIKSPGAMMDIDLDFSKAKRPEVYKYLEEKYGNAKVAHVATFGRMAAKAAIKNAARALGLSIASGEKVSKYIPNLPDVTIQDTIDSNKEFQDLILKDKEAKQIIDIARRLEGLPNNIGVHASAAIISDIDITDEIPFMLATRKDGGEVITQFEYKDSESCFFVKFDVLGLENLDIISETLRLIKENKGIDIDANSIDVNDNGIYSLLNDGYVTNIFQFDGSVASFLPSIKPSNINEVSAITSLCRPGPLSLGLHERYAEAKFKDMKFNYGIEDQKLLDKVWEICYTSYGLMVFQEQLIQCFKLIAGFDDAESEKARKATGKKDAKLLASLEEDFVKGGLENGYSEKGLRQLFSQFAGFSAYSFNAGHATAYSIITCQTAWLSYHYPLEFFVASLTTCSDDTDKVRHFIKAIKERGLKILPPDINRSEADFTIKDEAIVFGLSAIKGVGAAVTKKIMSRKPKSGYKTLGHFIKRNVDILNSKILESYTKAGCFNSFGYNKESILQNIPYILELIGIVKGLDKYNIFDTIDLGDYIEKCIITRVNKEDSFQYEIESLGLYITKHPMDDYDLNTDYVCDISKLAAFEDQDPFVSIGCLSGIEIRKTKAKLNMCSFNLTTGEDSVKCIMFPKVYSQFLNSDFIQEGAVVYINGKIKVEDSGKIIIVNDISNKVDKYLIKKKKQENIFKRLSELKEEDFIQHLLNLQLGKIKVILEK